MAAKASIAQLGGPAVDNTQSQFVVEGTVALTGTYPTNGDTIDFSSSASRQAAFRWSSSTRPLPRRGRRPGTRLFSFPAPLRPMDSSRCSTAPRRPRRARTPLC